MATYTHNYTTQFKTIIESLAFDYWDDREEFETAKLSEKIEVGRQLFFNEDFIYPIWGETDGNKNLADRKTLETLIIRHYYMHSIGFETIGLFKFHMETKLQEIMPYYIELYETQFSKLDVSPFINYKLHDEWVRRNEGTSKGETSANSKTDTTSRTLASDTPQAALLPELDYANSLNDINAENTGNATSNDTTDINSVEDYVRNVEGLVGKSYTDIVNDLRTLILNINLLIVKELADCFFGLF